ncbi:unnamed protein product, partial [Rotaria sp. Silwood1]
IQPSTSSESSPKSFESRDPTPHKYNMYMAIFYNEKSCDADDVIDL